MMRRGAHVSIVGKEQSQTVMSRTIHFADKGVRARTAASEPEVLARLRKLVGADNVLVDEERVEPYAGDALKFTGDWAK